MYTLCFSVVSKKSRGNVGAKLMVGARNWALQLIIDVAATVVYRMEGSGRPKPELY